jgi:hypothetical protein
MAQTTGFVQRLTILQTVASVWIGPTPTNTEALRVQPLDTDPDHVIALKSSIVDALAAALVSRREVVAIHGDNDPVISYITFEPA